jgi:hypothetical protein
MNLVPRVYKAEVLTPHPQHSTSYTIHYSLISLSFYTAQPELPENY